MPSGRNLVCLFLQPGPSRQNMRPGSYRFPFSPYVCEAGPATESGFLPLRYFDHCPSTPCEGRAECRDPSGSSLAGGVLPLNLSILQAFSATVEAHTGMRVWRPKLFCKRPRLPDTPRQRAMLAPANYNKAELDPVACMKP